MCFCASARIARSGVNGRKHGRKRAQAQRCFASARRMLNQRTSCHEGRTVGAVGLDCGDASVAAPSHSGGRRLMRGSTGAGHLGEALCAGPRSQTGEIGMLVRPDDAAPYRSGATWRNCASGRSRAGPRACCGRSWTMRGQDLQFCDDWFFPKAATLLSECMQPNLAWARCYGRRTRVLACLPHGAVGVARRRAPRRPP